MPRKKSKAVAEGNGPVPHNTFGLAGITMVEIRRIMSEALEKFFDKYYGLKPGYPKEKNTDQCLASLEHDAWQPRLAKEADLKPDTKTRKRTKDVAADRAKHGYRSFMNRVDVGQTSSTNFGMTAESPAFPCREDALVDKVAEVPKPCLAPVKMRAPPAAGG